MQLTSPAFADQQAIPAEYTCDGANQSPPLVVVGVPPRAMSLALIVHDPDAPGGDFVHWTIWNMAPTTKSFGSGSLPLGAIEGKTDFGRSGYGGPCPPSGSHRYLFTLYAVDLPISLDPSSTRPQLEQAMAGHILDQAVLTATYRRL